MQILFIDESGTPPPKDNVMYSPYFVLGGVIIPENYWHYVKDDLQNLKKRYRINNEIKWRYFAPNRIESKPHSMSHLNATEKESLRSDLFKVLNTYKSIRIISIVVNTQDAYKKPYINSADDIYIYAYKQITERFQYYLQDISKISGEKINGIIVCDNRAPKDDKRLQELHAKLILDGKASHSKYSCFIEGLFIAPSHLSVGIQFADMVAGAVLRKYKDSDLRFYSQIASVFRKSIKGEVDGYGLVYWPNE